MRLLLSFIFFLTSMQAMANTCLTVDKIPYKCGDIADMIQSINNAMVPFAASVYSFEVEAVKSITDLNVSRSMISFMNTSDNNLSKSYFQDYILNNTKGRFHLYHFVKNLSGKYEVYGERDQMPTGSFTADLKMASILEYVGTLESAEIDDFGMLVGTTIYSEFGTYNTLSHDEETLRFSIQEGDSNGDLILEEVYTFEYRILFNKLK